MSYFKLLGLDKEPFSTSPDPDFFYESPEHRAALLRLVVEVRLKRGLSVILGDIGTGKTTLSRKFFHMMSQRQDILFYMILDPSYDSEELFLDSLIRTFKINIDKQNPSVLDYKEALKGFLFQKGVEEKKTVVLLIDEAQQLNAIALEILRILLNYETNEYKLLQVVLLGQLELLPRIRHTKNLWDRISLKYMLNPLDEAETKEMIEFRLHKAGYNCAQPFFTDDAIREIHQYTQGYPRRISMLCHESLKRLVVESKPIVNQDVIRNIILQEVK